MERVQTALYVETEILCAGSKSLIKVNQFWTSGVGDMKDGSKYIISSVCSHRLLIIKTCSECGYIQIDSLTCGGEDFNWETTVQWCEIPGHEGDCDFSKREVKWNA